MSGEKKQQEFYKELKELLLKYNAVLCHDAYKMVVRFRWGIDGDDDYTHPIKLNDIENGK